MKDNIIRLLMLQNSESIAQRNFERDPGKIENIMHLSQATDNIVECLKDIDNDYEELEEYRALEKDLGISIKSLKYLKEGCIDAYGDYHKQCYLTFADNKWTLCDGNSGSIIDTKESIEYEENGDMEI